MYVLGSPLSLSAFLSISSSILSLTHRELQDLDEMHQVTIKVYKQRVKHLLHEHQNEIASLKTDGEVSQSIAQGDNREGEKELKKVRLQLKSFLFTLTANK